MSAAKTMAEMLSPENMARLKAEAETNLGIRHVDGIPWNEAPLPHRMHRCKPQTTSFKVERCACGAIRYTGDRFWLRKNESRTAGFRR